MIERWAETRSVTDPPRGAAGFPAETADTSPGAVMRPRDVGDRVDQAIADAPPSRRRVDSAAAAIDGYSTRIAALAGGIDPDGALMPEPAVTTSPPEVAVDGTHEWSWSDTRNRSVEDRPHDD